MKISIVTVCYNKYNFTKSALNDLFKLPDNNQIIIIDNASSDETQHELSKINKPNFLYIRNENNLYHSKACNQGYAASTSDIVLFINNDIKVRSNHNSWTDSIINSCQDDVLVGPTMGVLDKNFNFIKEANEQLVGNSYIGGWCIAGNKKTWNKIDLSKNEIWNEKIPMYFNDAFLSLNARKKGLSLKVIPLPDVVHFGKVSSNQLNVNKLYNEGKEVFLKEWKK